jgi:nucleoid DNA-binding protein
VKNAFIHIVKEVLAREQFVTLPGLGSFIVKELNSTINPINGEIKPRHSSIIFNNKISEDDGVLTSQYKAIFNLSYKEAQDTIKREINLLENQLTNKKYFAFNPLGNFFFNESSGIFFCAKIAKQYQYSVIWIKTIKMDCEVTEHQ